MNEPKLKLYVKDMAVEKVHETKPLGITVDSKPTWSKHIDKMVRGLYVIRRYSCFTFKSNVMVVLCAELQSIPQHINVNRHVMK